MKILYITLGSLSLALGILGIFLPVLPTTPFLLLTAALYFRSSPKLYEWLLRQKHLGPYIRNFREYRAIPLRAKIIAVTMLWLTMSISICVVNYVWLRIMLGVLAVAITWHILSYKTLRKQQ